MDFTRCYGCMRELPAPGAVCPHCGYDNTNDPSDPKKQPSHVLPCGTVLNGQYMVGRSLGQGGFGITYIGYDLNLEIPVCIKEYYPEGSAMRSATQSRMVYWGTSENAQSMKESRKSFVKEAQKAVKLRDLSHVVTVWGVFYENETAYIVMDYIEGETLKSRLVRTQKTLSEKECVELLTPVMEDLEKANKRGIIHRDIKPDNIMLTSDGEPMLLDMGAAKDLGKSGGSTRSSSTVVSQGFSPLEQYREKGDIGAWTDVYAMSATIYYCVTGKVPDAAIDRIIDDNVSFSAFTPAFAAALRKGLVIRPENRIRSMGELLSQLQPAIPGPGINREAQRLERERIERERREQERIEQERLENQRLEKERAERQRQEEAAELEKNYQRGKTLLAQGGMSSLREAESIFAALGRYRDAAMQAAECRRRLDQLKAEARIHKAPVPEQKQSVDAGATVGTGTKKSPIPLIAAVLVVAAIGFFAFIGGTGGSSVKATATPKQTADYDLSKAEVGSYITFGTYEQDNKTANGKEDVEWMVLAKEGDRVLLISRYALDCQQYNISMTDVTWETCSLRKWLNGTFLNDAFSEAEKAMIPSVTVSADKNPKHSTSPGNSTTDQVFLLSITEVNKYFSSNSARQCQATEYCYAQGAYKAGNGNCWWWLRSPGYDSSSAAYVHTGGFVYDDGRNVNGGNVAVRPALWVNLGS